MPGRVGRPRTDNRYSTEYGNKVTFICPVCKKKFSRYSSSILHGHNWKKTPKLNARKSTCCSRKCAALFRNLGKNAWKKVNTLRQWWKNQFKKADLKMSVKTMQSCFDDFYSIARPKEKPKRFINPFFSVP